MMIESTGMSFQSIARGVLGIITILSLAFLFSYNGKSIHWKTVFKGLIIQLILAIGVLFVPFIQSMFEYGGRIFILILDFSKEGSRFLLGDLVDLDKTGYIFIFQILPTIIFFSALTSLLFYLGVIQKIVYALAWGLSRFLRLSGAESLSVAGNIFLGQTESPLMIKAYLEKLNRSEIFLVMTGGMATIAGGVMAAYIGFLGGNDPVMRLMFAKHLLAASVMAAPGAVVLSKIIFPQNESINSNIEITKEKVGGNVLDAISNGTTEGIKLAVNVGGMLLVFIAFIALFNYLTNDLIGRATGLNQFITRVTDQQYNGLSLQFILGTILSPFMWLIGIAREDMALVGQLLGEKIILNEFIGYASLAKFQAAHALTFQKSVIMSTYILCGFANFGSIGIQIGGIGSLAPGKKLWLSEFGLRALIAGTLASCLSAVIVGMILG